MKNYRRFSVVLHRVMHELSIPDYVVLRTGDGHWMAIVGQVMILPSGRIIRPHRDVMSKLWCIIEDVRYKHPRFNWDFMDVISPYVEDKWVNFHWYKS